MSAKKEKKPSQDHGPLSRMREAYAAGDVRSARALAVALAADGAASDDARSEARNLRELTDVDWRALQIAAVAVALAAIYLGFFIL